MAIFRNIRLIFSFVVLIAILAVGGGLTYATHDEQGAAAFALGSMAVDPEAGYVDRAGQMIRGYKTANQAIEDTQKLKASDDEFASRSQGFMRDRYGPLGEPTESPVDPSPPESYVDPSDGEFAEQ